MNGLAMKMPALLTSVSMRPNRATPSEIGRFPIGDVAGNDQNVVVARRLDRARRRDHPVVAMAVRLDEGRADALRRAGNNSNFLFGPHISLLYASEGCAAADVSRLSATRLRRPRPKWPRPNESGCAAAGQDRRASLA